MKKESDGLVGHGSILLTATVISGIAHYFYYFYMIRALGPEDYGILFSLLASLMVLTIPAASIQIVIAKYISSFKLRKESGKIVFLFFHSIKKVFLFSSVGMIIFVLLSAHFSTFLKIPSRVPVAIVGFILLVFFILPITLGTLQGLQRFILLGVNIIIFAISRVVFGILLIRLGLRVNGALAASFFSGLITFLIAFLSLSFLFKREQIDNSVKMGGIYKVFVPTLLGLTCFGILTYIDVPLVKHFFPPLEAGYYSTAAIIGKAFLFPPMALAWAMFPKVSGYRNNPRFLLNKTLLLSVLLLTVGIVICVLFPGFILTILMKKKDLTPLALSTTIPLLKLFGIAMSPFALTSILVYYNLACNKTKFLYFLLLGTLLEVILLSIFHASLLQVVLILGFSGCIIFFFLFLLTHSKYEEFSCSNTFYFNNVTTMKPHQ